MLSIQEDATGLCLQILFSYRFCGACVLKQTLWQVERSLLKIIDVSWNKYWILNIPLVYVTILLLINCSLSSFAWTRGFFSFTYIYCVSLITEFAVILTAIRRIQESIIYNIKGTSYNSRGWNLSVTSLVVSDNVGGRFRWFTVCCNNINTSVWLKHVPYCIRHNRRSHSHPHF